MSSLRFVAALIVCVVLAGTAVIVQNGQRGAREQLEARFQARADLAEEFLHSYIQDLLERERIAAERRLGGSVVSQTALDDVVDAFGLKAAVVVDGAGNLLAVYPPRPEILGSSMSYRYDHLRRALKEGSAVSTVVPAAATGRPIVAFATRYSTPGGDRLFSGAWDLSQGPLRQFLGNFAPLNGTVAELVDTYGAVVSGNAPTERSSAAPFVPSAQSRAGARNGSSDGRRVVVVPVRGTPWRLIVSVPEEVLYSPISGIQGLVPWALFAGLCLLLPATAFLVVRLIEGRAQLVRLNVDLERLARVDPVTNVMNRRSLDEELDRWEGSARRHDHDFSVLIIDIDHFKQVNDTYGHAAGDLVLRELAACMDALRRVEDMLGRWGGEEFLAILPHTSPSGATRAAERMRAAVEACHIVTAEGATVRATVSIGCASARGAWDRRLLKLADDALYEAKSLGRNRVVGSAPVPRLLLVTDLEPSVAGPRSLPGA